jgi:hypothetical protein
MGKLTKKEQGDRSKIHVDDAYQVKCWAHKLGIPREDLKRVVDKVGNSAAEVRKELDARQRSRKQPVIRKGEADEPPPP